MAASSHRAKSAPTNDRINAANQSTYTHYGITPNWQTLAVYFSRIERQRSGPCRSCHCRVQARCVDGMTY